MDLLPPEIWSMLIAAITGIVVRVVSNRRVAAMRQILEEKDELIKEAERDVTEVRKENLQLGRERFRLRQRLSEHDIDDPTEDLPAVTEEEEHESCERQETARPSFRRGNE